MAISKLLIFLLVGSLRQSIAQDIGPSDVRDATVRIAFKQRDNQWEGGTGILMRSPRGKLYLVSARHVLRPGHCNGNEKVLRKIFLQVTPELSGKKEEELQSLSMLRELPLSEQQLYLLTDKRYDIALVSLPETTLVGMKERPISTTSIASQVQLHSLLTENNPLFSYFGWRDQRMNLQRPMAPKLYEGKLDNAVPAAEREVDWSGCSQTLWNVLLTMNVIHTNSGAAIFTKVSGKLAIVGLVAAGKTSDASLGMTPAYLLGELLSAAEQ